MKGAINMAMKFLTDDDFAELQERTEKTATKSRGIERDMYGVKKTAPEASERDLFGRKKQ